MKGLLAKLKEKWFWYKHPNLDYQTKADDEKTMWSSWLKSKDAHELLSEQEIEQAKQYLK